jgi:hypothetical protein
MKLAALALLALSFPALAANPYLHLPDETPVTRTFTGEAYDNNGEDAKPELQGPISAEVTTARLAKMEWGEIYKITFKTKPPILAERLGEMFLLVTDHEILQLASEDIPREIKVISEMKKQPKYDREDVLALSQKGLKYQEGKWITEVKIKGDICERTAYHDGNGNFATKRWQKDQGLIEIAAGQGADREGYRLKLKPTPKKPK